MKLQVHNNWPLLGWDDYEAHIRIKVLPNISINVFNKHWDEKVTWDDILSQETIYYPKYVQIELEWLIFSLVLIIN